jgi:hypothetical protein
MHLPELLWQELEELATEPQLEPFFCLHNLLAFLRSENESPLTQAL